MRYLVLVGHGRFADGLKGALEMLVGERSWLIAQSLEEGMGPDVFRERLKVAVCELQEVEGFVLLADICGGFPAKAALAELKEVAGGSSVVAFGGVNLPMALSAVMGIEDGLDQEALFDALLAEGTQALRAL